jgi:hypothetical protein
MSPWRKEPPTYDEWTGANNHGFWWVKFLLSPEYSSEDEETGETITWGEVWYIDIVMISVSFEPGSLLDKRKSRLHASGQVMGKFYLDDLEMTKNTYWQPVVAPKDNSKFDEEPQC